MKTIIFALLLVCGFNAIAQSNNQSTSNVPYQLGLHYTEINPAYPTNNNEEVVVYEFFSYMCAHCANFQPFMKSWHEKKPKNVKLVRIPVYFQPGWDIYAKAFYTAESMGILEKTHQEMFDAIHKKRKRMNSIDQLAQWYADEFGVDKAKFLSTAKSFMIDGKMRQSNNMMRKMQIRSTPTIIVNGKYKLNGKAAGSNNGLLDMATYLSQMEANKNLSVK